MNKRLYKSSHDRKVAGVCAGIAEYFSIDPTLVRVAWVIFTAMAGAGLIAYIACAIVMPNRPIILTQNNQGEVNHVRYQTHQRKSR